MSNQTHPVNFALVGFGQIGKRHARIIHEHPQARLTAIADINDSLSTEVISSYGVPFFSSVNNLLNSDVQADVVSIATPNGLHASQAMLALDYGRHVLVEKPMALTRADCEAVIHKALQKARLVFCVMQNRYSPPAQWLKSVIDQNLLGKIFLVQVNCYWNRDDRYYRPESSDPLKWKGTKALDGGPLFTQFSHFVDMMYWLFGDISNIRSHYANFIHKKSTEFTDDSGFVSFDFLKGGMGSFNYSTAVWDHNLESSMTIVGEKGSIKVGGQYMEQVEHCHIENYTMPELPPSNPPNLYGTHKGSAANHEYVIQNVIDTISGKSTITTNALEGMKVVEIIERIYQLHR